MIVNTALSVVAVWVLMAVTASATRALGGGAWATFGVQLGAVSSFAALLLHIGYIGGPIAISLVALVVGFRVFAYLWFWRLDKKYLNGDYGEEARWAAELAHEGDTEFIQAANKLTSRQMSEIGILSDSKEELRENVMDEADN